MATSVNGGETVAGVKMNGYQALLPVSMPPITAKGSIKELRHGRTAHNMSSSSLRKKSELTLVSKVRCVLLRNALANLLEVFLGTKLALLFPAIPLAIAAHYFHFGSAWLFGLTLLGLVPLAHRVRFLTEKIAHYNGPIADGLTYITCTGNCTELIMVLLALWEHKADKVKSFLVGSLLLNLLLLPGLSLLIGGVANLARYSQQKFDRKHVDTALGLLLLGVLCNVLPIIFKVTPALGTEVVPAATALSLSRACSIALLLLYTVYILFMQPKTRSNILGTMEYCDDLDAIPSNDAVVIGLACGVASLMGMVVAIAVLSGYVVNTIEDAANSWGLSISFISVVLLPITWNAGKHGGLIIAAYYNKPDTSVGVALGNAVQISVFMIPCSVLAGWIMGVTVDFDFSLIQTGSLVVSVLLAYAMIKDGASHYLKGLIFILTYILVLTCLFVQPPLAVGASWNLAGSGQRILKFITLFGEETMADMFGYVACLILHFYIMYQVLYQHRGLSDARVLHY